VDGPRLVKIDHSGRRTVLASTSQVPFLLKSDADGGPVYMDRPVEPGKEQDQEQGAVERITVQDIARGDAEQPRSRLRRRARDPRPAVAAAVLRARGAWARRSSSRRPGRKG
jgi:hypothetical protein